MPVYAALHIFLFGLTFICLLFFVRPRVKKTKNAAITFLFFVGVMLYGGLFPVAYAYVYSLFKPEYYGWSFVLTGVYGVLLCLTAGWLWTTASGKKDYRRAHNPFLFAYLGYGLLILIGCAVTAIILDQYIVLFE